jgi:predicted DNA-binding transcriptional regulator AlpA
MIVYMRRNQVAELLGIDGTTLIAWIKAGIFPPPIIWNPGARREIPVWPVAVVEAWIASRPQRLANPASPQAYRARSEQAAARRAARQQVDDTSGVNAPATIDERSPAAAEPVRPFLTRPQK